MPAHDRDAWMADPMRLYSADLCPYAQRVRAVLLRLQITCEQVEIDLDDRDPTFLTLTPTGRVPLLCDGDLRLYESAIILEYLAETAGWQEALADDPESRARQRLAMRRWDEVLLPAFYAALRQPETSAQQNPSSDAELAELECTLASTQARADSLLGYHCAPHWARARWLGPGTPLLDAVVSRPSLHAWLDSTLDLDPVRQTLPPRHEVVRRYRKMGVRTASGGG